MKSNIDKNKKQNIIIIMLVLLISISILGTTIIMARNRKGVSNRLTKKYDENKTRTNGLKGSDYIVKDEEGNVIVEDLGEYEPIKDDKTDKKVKKESEEFIYKFIDKLNEGNTNDLYSLFNQEYIKDFEYDLGKFNSNYYFLGGAIAEVTQVKEIDKRKIITTRITEKGTGAFKVIDFTMFEDGTIADIQIDNLVELNTLSEVNNVKYTIKRRYESRLSSIYIIDIDNASDRLLDVQDMVLRNNDIIYSYNILNYDNEIKVYPGIPYHLILEVPNNDSLNTIIFKTIDINGKQEEITLIKP